MTSRKPRNEERRALEKEAAEEDRKAAEALRATKLRTSDEPAFVFRARAR